MEQINGSQTEFPEPSSAPVPVGASVTTGPAAQPASKTIVTYSALKKLQCPRSYYFDQVLRLTSHVDGAPLRIGDAIHQGIEYFVRFRMSGETFTPTEEIPTLEIAAATVATEAYSTVPAWADAAEWEYERYTVAALLSGYFWYYTNDPLKFEAVEEEFCVPIVNPETNQASRTFVMAGKRDGRVILPDGRRMIIEHKTAGEDIGPGSKFWGRVRIDHQASNYAVAASYDGLPCDGVIYDVIRKPTTRPHKATPVESRKYTKEGKLYANQRATDETPAEWGVRLLTDISERPDYYFVRHEVARLDSDIEEFRQDVWSQCRQLADARRLGRWFKSPGRHCDYCEFAAICMDGLKADSETVPEGYARREKQFNELDTIGVDAAE